MAEGEQAEGAAASVREVVQVYSSEAGQVQALRGVTLDVRRQAVTAITGPSGAGKSTLLRLLACLEDPTAGEVVIDGTRPAELSRGHRRRFVAAQIGYVFQTPSDNVIDYLTVAEQLRFGGCTRSALSSDDVTRRLEEVGLAHAQRWRVAELSAGEQQVLAFAAAAAGTPTLLVADEPTVDLDPASREVLIELVLSLAERGSTLVISTHDDVLLAHCHDVALIRNGVFAAAGEGPGDLHAVVDAAGRVALPPDASKVLPTHRARVVRTGDSYKITRP